MTDTNQTAYLSGGCFWGMEDLVRQIPGLLETEVGYTGGEVPNATYEIVRMGGSGHAESLKIVFDPDLLTYRHLLFEFFRMHNPTTPNRQGNDIGTQYRSAIFYTNADQKRVADGYLAQLQKAQAFPRPIVTQVVPLKGFYDAEAYHQNYLDMHPNQPYIVINDLPKIAALKRELPSLYVGK